MVTSGHVNSMFGGRSYRHVVNASQASAGNLEIIVAKWKKCAEFRQSQFSAN